MGVWECGSVGVWECGSVGVWECASVRVCECASVRVCEFLRKVKSHVHLCVSFRDASPRLSQRGRGDQRSPDEPQHGRR